MKLRQIMTVSSAKNFMINSPKEFKIQARSRENKNQTLMWMRLSLLLLLLALSFLFLELKLSLQKWWWLLGFFVLLLSPFLLPNVNEWECVREATFFPPFSLGFLSQNFELQPFPHVPWLPKDPRVMWISDSQLSPSKTATSLAT